ncbi:spore germination protein [Fictibacillus sp. 18YEL24]|nr:spore germination protein [Fictibacillus sp. 18YEL24]
MDIPSKKRGRSVALKKEGNSHIDHSPFLSNSLSSNLELIQTTLGPTPDLKMLKFEIRSEPLTILYMADLVDSEKLQNILKSIKYIKYAPPVDTSLFEQMYSDIYLTAQTDKVSKMNDVIYHLLNGKTVILMDSINEGFSVDTYGGKVRAIEEPQTESLIRGPKVSFTEEIGVNIAMIRRQITDQNLKIESFVIGERGKKKVALLYIGDVINPAIVDEARHRLQHISIDATIDSGIIEQSIEDNFMSPFPQFISTERPDKVALSLLQGRLAIIPDQTANVLIAPVSILDTVQSPEDYYERWHIGSLLRMLRAFAVFISLFLPSFYIALVSFHQGLIPSRLAFSIAASREGVPFPAFVEALMMAITMELLREAGLRLPKPIGQTIGIVGGIVIGEAAVQAGIVSTVMVIVIAITAIASFTLPVYSMGVTYRILLFCFIFAAGMMGLYGISLAFIVLVIHIVNLTSLGIPYAAPLAPIFINDWKELFVRLPISFTKKRPVFLDPVDEVRSEKEE